MANRLEFVNGYATGRVLPPVMASATKAKWIREYAERENINLSEIIRIFGLDLRSANAFDSRPSGRGLSGYQIETNCIAARLGDLGFEMTCFSKPKLAKMAT